MINTFDDLNINEKLLKSLDDVGYEEPTPIQIQSIPPLLEGKDVIGQSQTGTGKTAAFCLPALSLIHPNKSTQVLVLCPTRELAIQATDEAKKFAKYMEGIKCVSIYGGQSIDRQIKMLRQGAHMVIGTPGRILDHISRNTLKLGKIKMVILDEADEMLNMGFREDIEKILSNVPEKRQTVLFSATMPKAIMQIVNKYQKDPIHIKTAVKQLTVPKIKQTYYKVDQGAKLDLLCTIIEQENPKRAIVFCNTKRMTDNLCHELTVRGYLAQAIHGDMRQISRNNVLKAFKSGACEILVATDVAARGIDVEDVSIVFNYDIPADSEYYVHRIGRTGRAGKDGSAISFVTGRKEQELINHIIKQTKSTMVQEDTPAKDVVQKAKIHSLLFQVENELKTNNYMQFKETLDELTLGKYSESDIACALISAIVCPKQVSTGSGMVKIELNVGKKQGVLPKHILGTITSLTNASSENIGKIKILDGKTVVEVDKNFADTIKEKLDGVRIKGVRIVAQTATSSNNKKKSRGKR